jgi:hypothetical protein
MNDTLKELLLQSWIEQQDAGSLTWSDFIKSEVERIWGQDAIIVRKIYQV